MRTAAGRRALQVVLLVGGLFALGFLCGEQAHAAERALPASSSEVAPTAPADGVRSLTSGAVAAVGRLANAPAAPAAHPAAPAAEPKPDAPAEPKPMPQPHAPAKPRPKPADPAAQAPSEAKPTRNPTSTRIPDFTSPAEPPAHRITESLEAGSHLGAADQILTPLTGHLVQSVGDRVVRPVGGLVETVTAGLGRVSAQIPPLPSLPGSPSLPSLPSLPGLPLLPGQILPAPVAQAPQPGAAEHSATDGVVDGRRSGAGAYGPRFAAAVTDAAPAHGDGRRVAGAGYAPPEQAPDGDPTGMLGANTAVDNGTSRHGDAHAVALDHRAPLRLVPGAAARADAAVTRDRHRDIPVFPA